MRATVPGIALALGCTAPAKPAAPGSAPPAVEAVPRCEPTEGPHPPALAQLPFGLFSAHRTDFADLAAAGFTMVGPWYGEGATEPRLDAAHRAGLGVIVPVGYDHDRYVREHRIEWSAEETVNAVAAQVRAVAEHPAVRGWYLRPEELRYWSDAEISYLRTATAAIRDHDPHARPIVAYQANNRTADQLEPIVDALDVLAKGTYANYTGHRDARAWVRWSVSESVEATRRASGTPTVWAVPEMFQEPAGATPEQIATWARHDVYASLLAGARGVLVFSGFRRPAFPSHAAYLEAYKGAARQLNGATKLAAALTSPRCAGPRARPDPTPDAASFATDGGTRSGPAIASRTTADATHWYLLTVNSSPRAVDVVLEDVGTGATVLVGPPLTPTDPPRVHLDAFGVSVVAGDNQARSASGSP